jgi:hypothetical protein
MEIPSQAIKNLIGTDYGYTFDQVNFDTLVFHDKVKRLNKSDYDAEVIRLQAEFSAQEYARKRQEEYPSYASQLDEIYHNGIDSWKAVIKVTKDKYPK